MHVHKSLNPTFTSIIRRKFSIGRSNDATSEPSAHHSHTRSRSSAQTHVYFDLDMTQRISWSKFSDPTGTLDEPATSPARTFLLVEVPELQAACINHGERIFKVERGGKDITVRDVLEELDTFLHRRAPGFATRKPHGGEMVGDYSCAKDGQTHGRRTSSTSSESAGSSDEHQSPLPLIAVREGDAAVAVGLPSETSLDRSDGTVESSHSGACEKDIYVYEETVLARWLGEKRVFAGMRRADNHDFKLIAKMKSCSARS